MTTIKSYTDIEQSKKLAEILPLESADMGYDGIEDRDSRIIRYTRIATTMPNMNSIPCWSLAALLSVLQKTAYFIDEDANVVLCSYKTVEWDLGINNSDVESTTKTNPVDACYEMIVKLHEQKIL